MSNTLNNVKDVGGVIAKMAAKMLADKVQFVKAIDKEDGFEGTVNGYSKGQTIYVNKPARFIVGTTADLTSGLQDVTEEKVAISLSTQSNVGVSLTSNEIATKMALSSWAKRILDPAMSSIAQSIESTALTTAKNAVFNQVGTAGSTTFDTDLMLSAREKLMKNLAPQDGKLKVLLDSTAMRSAVNARKGLFQSSSEVAAQYKEGYMGVSDGFHYLENNMLPVHTRGTQTGTFTVTTTSTTGDSTIALTGTSGGTLKAGDVFTVANVYAVHPITKATLNYLQQFVVTADNTAVSTAYSGVAISPSIYYSSPAINVTNLNRLPTSGDVVTIVGTASTGYTQNLAFHPSAFRFASVPLMLPKKAELAAQETVEGITVRAWQDTAILTDKMILRLDVLWGIAAVRPEWAVRLTA